MPLEYERTEEEVAERAAEAERDRLLAERVREAEARAAASRKKELGRIIAALDLLDAAPGELLRQAREVRAVRGGPLYNGLKPPPGPSLGGLLPEQMEEIQRRQASAEAGWRNEQAARARWVADSEDVIKRLCAGQTPQNQAQIRAQFAAQKAK